MNLISLFDSLEAIPDQDSQLLAAIQIPEYPSFRVAIDSNELPVVLLPSPNVEKITVKNFRLKHLSLQQNVECKVKENENFLAQKFTVIRFTSYERALQEYFFKIIETLVTSISLKPTFDNVSEAINKFIEVFRALGDSPTKTLQGLWSELFLIARSKSPEIMLGYWHCIPEEKFDFNAGVEKLEVKSSSNFDRIHYFASEQLHPAEGAQAIIASVFTRQNVHGKSIKDLMEQILSQLFQTELREKLQFIVSKTLGNTLEQSLYVKFDYDIALDSLRFFKHQEIKKIEEIYIPNEVSEVKYKSDLSSIPNLDLKAIGIETPLFKML